MTTLGSSRTLRSSENLSVIAAFFCIFFIYAMFAGGTTHGRSPNEQSRLELGFSLSLYGSVSIDPVLSVYGIPFDRSIREGKNYSDKAPGLSLISVPLVWLTNFILPREAESDLPSYWWVRHLLTLFFVVLPAALYPFLVLTSFTSPRPNIIPIALLFTLVTPVFTYATVFFGHVPAGVLAGLGWRLTLEADTLPTVRRMITAGLLLSLAASIEYPAALICLVIFVTMTLRQTPVRLLLFFLAAFILGFIPCLLYHHFAFGSPFTTGYAFKSDWWHGSLHQAGFFGVTIPKLESLWGILAGTKRGILFYCPLLLLVPFGLNRMEQQRKASSLPYIVLGLFYIWFAAGFSDWQAGWSAAARHLIPCLFILIFPFAKAFDFFAHGETKNSFIVLILVTATGLSMTGSFLSVSLSPFFPEHFSSPLGQLVLPAMAEGYFAPTLLTGDNLYMRGYSILLLLFLTIGAVSYSLIELFHSFRLKLFLSTVLITISISYITLLLNLTQPLGEEEHNVRRDVLKHIGYPDSSISFGNIKE